MNSSATRKSLKNKVTTSDFSVKLTEKPQFDVAKLKIFQDLNKTIEKENLSNNQWKELVKNTLKGTEKILNENISNKAENRALKSVIARFDNKVREKEKQIEELRNSRFGAEDEEKTRKGFEILNNMVTLDNPDLAQSMEEAIDSMIGNVEMEYVREYNL